MDFQKATKTNQSDHQRVPRNSAKPVLSPHTPIHPVLQLQRALGNEAFGRLVQAKLRIGQPGDIYEQEADRVAELIMRMLEPSDQKQTEEDEEELIQGKPLAAQMTPLIERQIGEYDKKEEEGKVLQTKEVYGRTSEVTPILESRINALKGGQPLPESVRAFFEPRFGYDFSQVRLHSGSMAAETTSALNARAFTIGQNIVFGTGQYAPEILEGCRLLAHELAHTIQQNGTTEQTNQQTKNQKFGFEIRNPRAALPVLYVSDPAIFPDIQLARIPASALLADFVNWTQRAIDDLRPGGSRTLEIEALTILR